MYFHIYFLDMLKKNEIRHCNCLILILIHIFFDVKFLLIKLTRNNILYQIVMYNKN